VARGLGSAQAPLAGPAAERIWAVENASSDNIFGSLLWSCANLPKNATAKKCCKSIKRLDGITAVRSMGRQIVGRR